jgi:hypothetical protein
MAGHPRLHRADDNRSINSQLIAQTREVLAESRKLLAEPAPDTFLGRRRNGVELEAPEPNTPRRRTDA